MTALPKPPELSLVESVPLAKGPGEAEALRAVRTLLAYLGEEPEREGLRDTPARVLKSFREQLEGYKQDPGEILARTFDEVAGYKETVLLRDISFTSMCEHHLLPFEGIAHVAYLPGDRVVGLSKLARLVHAFARRLQIQERLTQQIVDALMTHLAPRGAAAILEAGHGCMRCRGVQVAQAKMITASYAGELSDALAKDTLWRMLGR